MRRGLPLVLALGMAVGWSATFDLARPLPVAALSCVGAGPSGQSFAGNLWTHTNAVNGAKANIEYVNEGLCTTSGGEDFSSFWTAVVGNPGVNNIYQVGVDKCRGTACPSGVPANQSYYFYAYGRNASTVCGAAVGPRPYLAPKGNAGAGTQTYKVIKEYTPGAGWFWNLFIGTARQYTRAASDLDTCWSGVDRADVFNEVWDKNAQSGGSVGNNQLFSGVYWHNGTTWNAILGVGGANCGYRDLSTMRCVWQYNVDRWDSWDSRWP